MAGKKGFGPLLAFEAVHRDRVSDLRNSEAFTDERPSG
ncbi:hypothetical protein FHS87_004131 [Roseomonas pecuniae]|uniref:Uncharacterized protein n=1 Tax=Muricoccus pecuniae TaxID=693023 RepID=A0A840YM82_9PROT|nr:hypothetical protein [Roseomonas pecuniae]